MEYIDGCVAAVPTANREAYIEHARKAAELFKEYGALRLVENWGNDVPEGKVTSFPMAVKCKPEETVVLSWIVWPSKAIRDQAWEKIMQDERMQENPMPFDGSRMIFGGFETILNG